MSVLDALAAARAAGIEVELDAGDLVVSAAGELPAYILDLLRTNKPAIVEHLRAQASPIPSAPPPSLSPAQPRGWSAADWRLFHNDRQLVAELALGKTRQQARTYAYVRCIREWCRVRPGATEEQAIAALVEKGITDPSSPPPAPAARWSAEEWLAYRDERAAIAEHDGKLDRRQAEERAFQSCVAEWLDQHPASSSPEAGCPICGGGDRPGDDLLPIGIGRGEERTWLHSSCIPVWRSARMDAAASALAKMGISGPEGSAP